MPIKNKGFEQLNFVRVSTSTKTLEEARSAVINALNTNTALDSSKYWFASLAFDDGENPVSVDYIWSDEVVADYGLPSNVSEALSSDMLGDINGEDDGSDDYIPTTHGSYVTGEDISWGELIVLSDDDSLAYVASMPSDSGWSDLTRLSIGNTDDVYVNIIRGDSLQFPLLVTGSTTTGFELLAVVDGEFTILTNFSELPATYNGESFSMVVNGGDYSDIEKKLFFLIKYGNSYIRFEYSYDTNLSPTTLQYIGSVDFKNSEVSPTPVFCSNGESVTLNGMLVYMIIENGDRKLVVNDTAVNQFIPIEYDESVGKLTRQPIFAKLDENKFFSTESGLDAVGILSYSDTVYSMALGARDSNVLDVISLASEYKNNTVIYFGKQWNGTINQGASFIISDNNGSLTFDNIVFDSILDTNGGMPIVKYSYYIKESDELFLALQYSASAIPSGMYQNTIVKATIDEVTNTLVLNDVINAIHNVGNWSYSLVEGNVVFSTATNLTSPDEYMELVFRTGGGIPGTIIGISDMDASSGSLVHVAGSGQINKSLIGFSRGDKVYYNPVTRNFTTEYTEYLIGRMVSDTELYITQLPIV